MIRNIITSFCILFFSIHSSMAKVPENTLPSSFQSLQNYFAQAGRSDFQDEEGWEKFQALKKKTSRVKIALEMGSGAILSGILVSVPTTLMIWKKGAFGYNKHHPVVFMNWVVAPSLIFAGLVHNMTQLHILGNNIPALIHEYNLCHPVIPLMER